VEIFVTAKVLAFPGVHNVRPFATDAHPADVDPGDLRQRILVAAHALYLEPRKVGLAEIAAAAGVSATDVEAVFGDETSVRRAVLNELLAYALAAHPCL
jgi:AcrR family transcriptional regulator